MPALPALAALAALVVPLPPPTPEADLYEIEVYGAGTVERGRLLVEQHFNVTEDHGAHLTYEIIYGLTGWLEAATYFATRFAPGSHDFAWEEWRLRVRPRTPDGWPVRASLNLEMAFTSSGFASLEVRPIWTGELGRLRLDLAPALEFDSAGTADLQPEAKLAVSVGGGVEVGVEYYANLGEVSSPEPVARQWHQLYLSGDLVRWKEIEIDLAVGVGLTCATDGLVVKSILGYLF